MNTDASVPPMSDRFIFTKYRTDCYHCKELADQIIKAVPYQAQVACNNCGATRVFVPRSEDVDAAGTLTRIGKYPVWEWCRTPRAGTVKLPAPRCDREFTAPHRPLPELPFHALLQIRSRIYSQG